VHKAVETRDRLVAQSHQLEGTRAPSSEWKHVEVDASLPMLDRIDQGLSALLLVSHQIKSDLLLQQVKVRALEEEMKSLENVVKDRRRL